jgi:hypothetical protein
MQGIGTQLIPLNVWANPAYWPFAFFGRELAADVSAAVALAIFMIGCYITARCFDLAPVPSVIAAQFGILLFAPTELLLNMPSNFTLNPGAALVYTLHMSAGAAMPTACRRLRLCRGQGRHQKYKRKIDPPPCWERPRPPATAGC